MRWIVPLAALVALLALTGSGLGQPVNPVYMDDSERARDGLFRAVELAGSGNAAEGARVLQRLLDEVGDGVIEAEGDDEDLFVSVRSRVHRLLLEEASLLEAYRRAEGVRAERLLEAGEAAKVERTRLLTSAGLEAALRVAESHVVEARFEAARLTLEQLESHPDREGRLGEDAARLLALVGRYLDRDSVRSRAVRWAGEAGLEASVAEAEPFGRPAGALRRKVDVYSPAEGIDLEEMLDRPLRSVIHSADEDGATDPQAAARSRRSAETAARPLVLPTVVGDVVLVSDGENVSAWDRFSLDRLWHVRPPMPDREEDARQQVRGRRMGVQPDDVLGLDAGDGVAVVGTADPEAHAWEGGHRLHGLRLTDGRVLWSVDVDRLDPSLEGGAVRGVVRVDEDTAVAVVRRFVPARRLWSVSMVGLDAWTGDVRWVRLLASAGSRPYAQPGELGTAGLIDEGVLYRADEIGIVSAVEVATGRVLWSRRMPVPTMRSGERAPPSLAPAPVRDGEALIVLSPDMQRLVKLEASTGRVLLTRDASVLGYPRQILLVDGALVGLARDRVVTIEMDDIKEGQGRTIHRFRGRGMVGRAVLSGDLVLCPTDDGLVVLDPRDEGRTERIELASMGNIVPVAGQIIAADRQSLHSYLVWSDAESLLTARLEANRDDASPALTLTELAFRAGRPERALASAEAALEVIGRDPASGASRESRRRLFETLDRIVESAQRRWHAEDMADPSRPDEAGERIGPEAERLVESGVLPGLIEAMGQAARSEGERVAYKMALGRLHESDGAFSRAIEVYQTVLDDAVLASEMWAGPGGISVRSAIEATRRVRRLHESHGAEVYAVFDREARREAEALGERAAPEEAEALARRFPLASVAPSLWLRAAHGYTDEGREHDAQRALRAGLDAALADPDPEGAGAEELGGRLIRAMKEQGRFGEAVALAGRLDRAGLMRLSVGEETEELEALIGRLSEAIEARTRRPSIGKGIDHDAPVRVLRGWRIERPLSRAGSAVNPPHVLLSSPGGTRLSLWAQDESGELERRWVRPAGHAPALVRHDPDALFFFSETGDGGRLERLDAETGDRVWRTPPLRRLFDSNGEDEAVQPAAIRLNNDVVVGLGDEEAFRQRRRGADDVQTPLDGRVGRRDAVYAGDEQIMAIVERSGRVAAFDPEDGDALWTARAPMDVVHDVDAGSGFLVVAGVNLTQNGRGPTPVVAVYDARRGSLVHSASWEGRDGPGQTRWVRVLNDGRCIVGLEYRVLSLDLAEGRVEWVMADPLIEGTLDAWVWGDRLFLLSGERALLLGSVSTGRLRASALETRGRMDAASRLDWHNLGERGVFAGSRGVVVIGEDASVVGMDALGSDDSLLPAVAASDVLVTLDARARRGPDGASEYDLHFLDLMSGRLVGHERLLLDGLPDAIAVLDGVVLISSGSSTSVLRTKPPAGAAERRNDGRGEASDVGGERRGSS